MTATPKGPAGGAKSPLTDTQLRATPVAVAGPLTDTELRAAPVDVADDYTAEDHTADQVGADAVLTFTLGGAAALVMVDVDPTDPTDVTNYRARATCDGTDPSDTVGFVCRPGTSYLPVATAGIVKVYAPSGVTVAVQATSRG